MKTALAGTQPEFTRPQPVPSGIPATGMEDGGYVRSVDTLPDGTKSYNVGRPGLGGAIQDLVEHVTHGGVHGGQKTAAAGVAERVNSNEVGHRVGMEEGGAVPTGVTGVLDAMNTGSQIGARTYDAAKKYDEEKEKDAATEAALEPDTGAPPAAPAPEHGAIATAVMHPVQAVRHAVNSLADFLHLNSHDTKAEGVDTSSAPVAAASGAPATPETPGAAPAATTPDEAAATVKPSAEPATKPQTLGPDFYEQVHNRAIHAAHLAAKAGLDPQKMYDSSMAMAVTHMQGKVMRAYGDAFTAYQTGDMKGVETALQNADYYKPNGKTLKFSHASDLRAKGETIDPSITDDTLMVRNPMLGYPGHEKDQTNIPITPQTIHLMATASLDPQNFHTELASISKAETEAMKDAAKAKADQTNADAALMTAGSRKTRADGWVKTVPSIIFKNIAAGDKDEAKANGGTTANGQPKISLSQAQKVSNDAANSVYKLSTGLPTATPGMVPAANGAMGPDGKPLMVPSMAPNAGHAGPDPTKVPPDFKDLPPGALTEISANASAIARANAAGTRDGTGVSADEAAMLAAKIYQFDHGYSVNPQTGQVIHSGPHVGSHIRPGTKAPNAQFDKDVVRGTGKDAGIVHVWTGAGWKDIYSTQNLSDEAIDTGGGAGESNSSSPEDQGVDTTDTGQ
jgi:hypothetical protein